MVFKDLFINLSIFSFLVSTAIFIQVFVIRKIHKSYHWFGGLYAGIVAIILMFYPVKHNELIYDLRSVPLILSFVYFGRTGGWITIISICMMRIYIGGHWIPSLIATVGTGLLLTMFKTFLKNLHPFKNSFLYLTAYMSMYSLVFKFVLLFKLSLFFEVQRVFFISFGLLIGIFLIESYYKLHRLTQQLSKMNQTLAQAKQELQDTVHEQQGGIFKFKKVNEHFIHTLCDGQFFYQNGLRPEQVVGKDLQTINFLSHLVPQLLEYYQRAWAGQEVTFELPWSNDTTIILISLRPIKREGKVIEVVGSAIDITQRKKMEEELRTTKEQLESFVNHNLDAIIISDLKGHILQVNKAFEEVFGWSIQEIKGQILPCVPDFLIDQAFETISKIISGEPIITKGETVRQRKDGGLIDVNVTLSPILDSKGNVIALSAIYKDISKRKQAERELHQLHQQLRENEMKYRILFEQTPDAVFLVEMNEDRTPSRYIEVNPAGCERLEFSREELLSVSFTDIVSQDSTIYRNITEKIGRGERSFTLQNESVFKSGKKMNVELSLQVFNLSGKEVFLAISRDITERLKTEELLRKSEKLAVVGQLATAIAHEIRNPLTTMKGFMQLLKSMENENIQFYVDVMLSEVDQIESITNEFITIAKPQAVKVKPNDLQVLVEQVTILLQPQATMNNVQIRKNFESDIPFIHCEGNQLKQVFINILKNAIESMSLGGEVLIQVNKLDDQQVCIRFIDQGCGIPKERLPHLGEPFYSIKEKGIGLGLMVCYKIIEVHQGNIVIESEVNKGTIVDIILPIYSLQDQDVRMFSYVEARG